MINLFGLGDNTEQLMLELPALFEKFEREVHGAKPIFDIEGSLLEKIARDLPRHQFYYAGLMQDARAIMKWLEIQKAQKESRHVKNYNNQPRALGVKEQSLYIQGEKDVVELNQLIVSANLYFSQFEEIVESLKQMGWMLGSIVKLRVSEMHDVII